VKGKTIFKLAMMTAILGIFLLFLLSELMKPMKIGVCDVNEGMADKEVRISGEVKEFKDISGGHTFTLKEGNCSVKVVLFSNSPDVKLEGRATVIGKVQVYKQKLEVLADEISVSKL
jgi:RecJ-like exonuclease